MFLSSVSIEGFRASASEQLICTFPDRFSVLIGPNNSGKSTICEALYHAHQERFPYLPRASSGLLGDSPRKIDIAFSFGGVG